MEILHRGRRQGSRGSGRRIYRRIRRILHPAGTKRMWKIHYASLHRGIGGPRLRRDHVGREGSFLEPPAPIGADPPAKHRHGLPVIRHLAPHERIRQRRLPGQDQRRPEPSRKGHARPRSGRARSPGGPGRDGPLGWAAAARGGRQGHRHGRRPAAVRRAVEQSGQQASASDAL